MTNETVKVAIANGNTVTDVTELSTSGQPVRIKAVANGKYILAEGDKDLAPQNITVKRVGKDLHVTLEGGDPDQPQLIIEGFYDAQGQLVGMAEDGNFHEYIAADAEQDHGAAFLIEGVSSPQVLGVETVSGMSGMSSVSGGVFGTGIGMLGAGLIGLAALGLVGVAVAAGKDDDKNDDPAPTPPAPVVSATGDDVGSETGPLESGASTDDTTPTFSGEGTPGNTIIIKDGDKVIGETIIGEDGKWTYTPEPLVEGSHEFVFIEKDRLGNEGPPSPGFEINIDVQAPAQAVINNVQDDIGIPGPIEQNGQTNDATPILNGQAEPGSTVEIFANGEKIGEAAVDADGTWSFTPSPLADDTYSFTVVAVDAAGNRGLPSDPFVLSIDTSVPGTPGQDGNPGIGQVINDDGEEIPAGGSTNDNTPTFVGSGQEPGTTVTLRDENGAVIGETTVDPDGNWSVTPDEPLSDENHEIVMVITDPAGNESLPSDPFVVVVDTTAPGTPGQDGNPGIGQVINDDGEVIPAGGSTNDTTPTFVGSGQEPGSTITLRDENGAVIGEGVVDADGNWSVTPDMPLSEDDHEIIMTVTDPTGNVSLPSDPYVVTIDTTAPGTPGENGNAGIGQVINDDGEEIPAGGSTNDNTPTFTGGSQTPGETITIYDGLTPIGTAEVDGSGNWSFTPDAPLSDEDHEITMTVTDPAGNESAPSVPPYVITVDTLAPGIPGQDGNGGIDTVINDTDPLAPVDIGAGDSTNDTTPTLVGGNQQPGDTVTIYNGADVIGSAVVDALGNWAITPAGALDEGTYSFTMTVTDQAQNESAPSDPYVVIVDTTAPGTPGQGGNGGIDTVINDTDPLVPVDIGTGGSTNDTTPTLVGGNQQPGDTVTIYNGTNIIGSAVVDALGNWAITPTGALVEGSYSFTMTVTDPAHNESAPSDPYVVIVDTTAPGTPGQGGSNGGFDVVNDNDPLVPMGIADGGFTNDNTPLFTGGGQQPDDIVKLYNNGAVVGSAIVQADGTWTFTPDPVLADDTYSFTMTVTDQANNESAASDPYVFTVDTIAPAKPGDNGDGIGQVIDNVNPGGIEEEILNGDSTNDDTPTLKGGNQLPGGTVTIYNGVDIIGTAIVDELGNWEITPLTPLEDNTYNFTMTVTDLADNESEPSDPFEVTVDTTPPPAIAIDSMGKDAGTSDFITNDGSAGRLVQGSLTAALATGEKVQVSLDNGATWMDAVVNGTTWSFVDLSAHSGDWTVQARVIDLADNVTTATQDIQLDTVVPNAPTSLEFNGSVVTVNFDGTGVNVGDMVEVVVGNARFEVQLTQAQIDAGSVDVATNANAAMTNTHAMLVDGAGNVSQQLMPVLVGNDFESAPVVDVPVNGTVDFGAFTFNWGAGSRTDSPEGVVVENTIINGFTTPSRGLGIVADSAQVSPSIILNDGVEAGAVSFLVGGVTRPITLNFYDSGNALVHSVLLPPNITGVQEVNFQLPGDTTFTRVEFDASGAADWLWIDDITFSTGDFDQIDAPTSQHIDGTGGYYGADDANVFSLDTTAFLNNADSVISGGAGIDTLTLTGTGQVLNLTNIAGELESVEIIDIGGSGNNTLTLSLGDVLEQGQTSLFTADDTVQMMIKGNTGDVVNLDDQLAGTDPGDWAASGTVDVGGVTYNVYSHSTVDAELLVQQGVTTNLV